MRTVSAAAIQTIEEALSTSTYLEDVISGLVDKEASLDNGVATLDYRVPGLQPVDRQVRLVASNDEDAKEGYLFKSIFSAICYKSFLVFLQ